MTNGGAVPGQRPWPALSAHYGPRSRVLDDHMFAVPTRFGGEATFRLQLFTGSGLRPVAVATQAKGDAGSIVNDSEVAAAFVWREHAADQLEPPLWVERMLPYFEGDSIRMMIVSFQQTSSTAAPLESPRSAGISPAELELLVGEPVDLARGEHFVPRPEQPPRQTRFDVMHLADIPAALPFREPGCMGDQLRGPARIRASLRRSWVWQRISRQSCCWYHGGDWHRVNQLAEHYLAAAKASGTDDVKDSVLSAIREADEDTWTREALWSLFAIPIDLNEDDDPPSFVNGQHRVQAMRDSRVRRTIVIRYLSD